MKNITDRLKEIFPLATHQRIFLVGGVVRDFLLGQVHLDIDLAAALTKEEFEASGFRLVIGKSTSPIWFRHDTGFGTIEATPLTHVADLSVDLHRRDFTINAMAISLTGEFIDPLGGRGDLAGKLLRNCTPETFIDDPLRIFRALRFEADGWRMTPESEELIRSQDWSSALSHIPVERFSREMIKALGTVRPEEFFERMLELNIGENFLPELYRMPDIPAGPFIHHPEGDLFTHSIQVLQRLSPRTIDPLARFSAMFHDLGKLATSPALYPKHYGHDQAGFKLAAVLCQRLRLPAQYDRALSWVSRLHGTFNLWDQLRDATKLRVADQAIKAGIVDILPLVAAADKAGGKEPEEWRAVVAIAGMSACELGIDLKQLEQMQPSKRNDHIQQKRVEKHLSTRTVLL